MRSCTDAELTHLHLLHRVGLKMPKVRDIAPKWFRSSSVVAVAIRFISAINFDTLRATILYKFQHLTYYSDYESIEHQDL